MILWWWWSWSCSSDEMHRHHDHMSSTHRYWSCFCCGEGTSASPNVVSDAAFVQNSMSKLVNRTHGVWKYIAEKVSFNIASEASYVYILSGQKIIKNAKMVQIGEFLRTWSLRSNSVTRQVILMGQKLVNNAKIQIFKCDILSTIQTMWKCQATLKTRSIYRK